MKVTPERDYKRFWTLEDADAAKVVKRVEKDDETKLEVWAACAAEEALKGSGEYLMEIIKAKAEIVRNPSLYERDVYGEGSGYMDVCITALAKITQPGVEHAYMWIVAMLSDIWQHGSVDYKDRMYVEVYKRSR